MTVGSPCLVMGLTLTAVFCGCGSSSPASQFQLLDDMDHADGSFPAVPPGSSSFFWQAGASGGLGNWFVSSPNRTTLADASIEAITPPRGDSQKACHVSGDNLERGTDLWVQLDHPSNRPVDLSAYAGIAFWARLDSPSGRLIVAINDQRGNSFFDAAVNTSPWPWRARQLASSEWERVVLLFDDFAPGVEPGNSAPRALDTSAVISIDFVAGSGGEPFDLWIDDLMLLCRGNCPS